MRRYSITVRQMYALKLLHDCIEAGVGYPRSSDLAKASGLNRSNVGALLINLIERGAVTVFTPLNEKGAAFRITKHGQELLKKQQEREQNACNKRAA